MRTALIAGLLCVALSGAAYAQKSQTAQPQNGQPQTQADMDAQADQDREDAEHALNGAYQGLAAQISRSGRMALQTAERTWLRFRDQECAFETMGSVGGSIHSMVLAQCVTALDRDRTAQIEKQLNCQEGDVACGSQ